MEKRLFDETTEIKDFTKRCLMNESIYAYKGSIEIIQGYWEQASNISQFVDSVIGDSRLENNQGYWELAKEKLTDYKLNDMIIKNLSSKTDESYITYSDIGSISVGNDNFRYNIPNNYGDCENNVFIINSNKHIECLKFETTISGDNINLYDYDCGNDILYTLKGKYAVYLGIRVVAFVKWE